MAREQRLEPPAMADANEGQSEGTAIVFRIGLHLGDLIVDGDDLYTAGIAWALRALNDMPTFPPAHVNLVICLVGAGEIEKAKVAFATGQKMAPAFFRSRLDGHSLSASQSAMTRKR